MKTITNGPRDEVRSLIRVGGASALVINDLGADDLVQLDWSGSPLHIESMRNALNRVPSGEVEYLVVRAPDGTPIAKGGIEYTDRRGPGKVYQPATHAALQGLGIGTHLICALEERIRGRGIESSWLGVEPGNPARRLYERLSYGAFAEEKDGWATQDATGRRYWKETLLVLMRHPL